MMAFWLYRVQADNAARDRDRDNAARDRDRDNAARDRRRQGRKIMDLAKDRGPRENADQPLEGEGL